MNRKQLGIAMFTAGAVLSIVAFIWTSIVGYYPNELPIIAVLWVGGVALLYFGSKFFKGKDPNKAVEWTPAPPAAAEAAFPATPPAPPAAVPVSIPTASAVDDATSVIARRPLASSGWIITLPDGTRVPLTADTLIGRDPVAAAGQESAALVAVADADSSVSKTHARLIVRGGILAVTDLGSTNGSVVVTRDGTELPAPPSVEVIVPHGASLEIGMYVIAVE